MQKLSQVPAETSVFVLEIEENKDEQEQNQNKIAKKMDCRNPKPLPPRPNFKR